VIWYERSIAADADVVDAEFLVRFAEAQSQTGNVAAARDSLLKALAIDPLHRGARTVLRRLPR
jgi:Tfp pilus assembly protein PilF